MYWPRAFPDPEVQEEFLGSLKRADGRNNDQRILESINLFNERRQSVDFCVEYSGKTPLHLAAERGLTPVVVSLVAARASIERRDKSKKSAMHYAIMKGHKETVKCLQHLGASIRTSLNGMTALHLAFYYGKQDVADYLLEQGIALDVKDDCCRTPVASVSRCGDMSENWIIQKIQHHICIRRSDGSEFLVCAAEAGLFSVVQYLIKTCVANGNTRRKDGQTALMAACQSHHAHEKEYKQIVRLLLDTPVSVDIQDAEGNTALHFASRNDVPDLVEMLLDSGANPNIANKQKETPLYLARKSGYGEIIEALNKCDAALVADGGGESWYSAFKLRKSP